MGVKPSETGGSYELRLRHMARSRLVARDSPSDQLAVLGVRALRITLPSAQTTSRDRQHTL
jgi:hypothetical protein